MDQFGLPLSCERHDKAVAIDDPVVEFIWLTLDDNDEDDYDYDEDASGKGEKSPLCCVIIWALSLQEEIISPRLSMFNYLNLINYKFHS